VLLPSFTLGWVFLNLSLFFVCMALVILPHEAGHALFAWFLGLRVFRIGLGRGKTLLEFKFRRTRVEFNAIPFAGGVWAGFPSTHFFRLKSFLLYLAGPMANGVLLAACLWWWTPKQLLTEADQIPPRLLFGLSFTGANLLVLAYCLFPYKYTVVNVQTPSDGLALLTVPWYSRAQIEQIHAFYFYLEGMECVKDKQHSNAIQWFECGLRLYPRDLNNQSGLGHALIPLKEHARARHFLLAVLSAPGLPLSSKATILENIVIADLALLNENTASLPDSPVAQGQPYSDDIPSSPEIDLLLEAELFSEEALAIGSHLQFASLNSFQATRGCVLVEQGKTDEALALLHKVITSLQDSYEIAFSASYIALAEARRGRVQEAEHYLETARDVYPDCVVIPRVTRELHPTHASAGTG
jgi:tetratricopeptide (TPR) repeat protein